MSNDTLKKFDLRDTLVEHSLTFVDKLLPCRAMQSVLEICDRLPVPIIEDPAEERVVCNSKASPLIAICNACDLYRVSEDGKTMSFQKLEHNGFT